MRRRRVATVDAGDDAIRLNRGQRPEIVQRRRLVVRSQRHAVGGVGEILDDARERQNTESQELADRIAKATPGLCPGIVAATALYPGLACDEGPFARAVAARIEVPVRYWNALDTSVNELERSSIAVPGGRFATFAGHGHNDLFTAAAYVPTLDAWLCAALPSPERR